MAKPESSPDSKQPDLEEVTNVAQTHAEVLELNTAAAREKQIEEAGLEPVNLWVFLVCALVLFVGGAVMGAGGRLFNYSPFPNDSVVRAHFESAGDDAVIPLPADEALIRFGRKIYDSKCAGCHQSSGQGQPPTYPPLAGSEWTTGSTERFAMIVLNGLTGPIDVNGVTYGGVPMPAQMVNATELAAVMSYVRNSWTNSAGIVTPEQGEEAVRISRERNGGQTTVQELNQNHDRDLPGDPFPEGTMLNPETLEPVEAEGE